MNCFYFKCVIENKICSIRKFILNLKEISIFSFKIACNSNLMANIKLIDENIKFVLKKLFFYKNDKNTSMKIILYGDNKHIR